MDAFFRVAVANGGVGDGDPGLRPEYDDNYYAAFVRDPDGNKIEAVTFRGCLGPTAGVDRAFLQRLLGR